MALAIKGTCHNLYLSGDANLGRSYFAREYFQLRAAKQETPPDQLYLHNFSHQDHPISVSLPAGQGKEFKNAMSETVSQIKEQLPAWFEREPHVKALKRFPAASRMNAKIFSQIWKNWPRDAVSVLKLMTTVA